MSTLVVESLSAGYHKAAVLQNITFSLTSGHCLALVGPNGGGKSTLLKALIGLVGWRNGQLRFGDLDLMRLPAVEVARAVAHVPQSEEPDFPFSVADAIRLGRLPHGSGFLESEEDLRIADEAMETAGCLELAGRSVTELSGGELQRVLLARALAQSTPVLLLDEPTAHLDPQHVKDFVRIAKQLKAQGRTLILATHDLNLARHLAEVAMLVSGGVCKALGPTPEVLRPEVLSGVLATQFRVVEDWLVPSWE